MNRRTMLVATALGLAGCISAAPRAPSLEDQPSPTQHGEDPRIDEPPYQIDEPVVDEAADWDERREQWNEHYLGDHQPTQPSLTFEPIDVPGIWRESTLNNVSGSGYGVNVFTDYEAVVSEWDTRQRAKPTSSNELPQVLESIDFEDTMLVEILAGAGTPKGISVSRVEETEHGVHIHAYHTVPFEILGSWGPRNRLLLIEYPGDPPDITRVSLTRSPTERVHFNSREGVVEIPREAAPTECELGRWSGEDEPITTSVEVEQSEFTDEFDLQRACAREAAAAAFDALDASLDIDLDGERWANHGWQYDGEHGAVVRFEFTNREDDVYLCPHPEFEVATARANLPAEVTVIFESDGSQWHACTHDIRLHAVGIEFL